MSHIFISYSRKDFEFARKIVEALGESKIDTWGDWKSIPSGENWEHEIYHAIKVADTFLFLISPDSIESVMSKKEIAHAIANNKRIFPVLIRDTDVHHLPPAIAERNWVFCRDGVDDFDHAITEIIKAIHTDYEWMKFHVNLQSKALEWERSNKDVSWLLRGKQLKQAELMLVAGGQKEPLPTDLQRHFVSASIKEEQIRKSKSHELSEGERFVERKRNLKVFLCHSSFDKPMVRKLHKRLTKEGFDVWLDESRLVGGQDWETEIKKAVKTSHIVLVCLSKSSVNKVGFIQKEIRYALDIAQEHPDEDIYIIPLRLEDCIVPERLSRWQWVDFHKPKGYEKLVKALDTREEQIRS